MTPATKKILLIILFVIMIVSTIAIIITALLRKRLEKGFEQNPELLNDPELKEEFEKLNKIVLLSFVTNGIAALASFSWIATIVFF